MKGPKTNDRRFPLPRRTGHGDFPHPALAKVVSAREHSQRLEAQVFQMSIQTEALPFAPAPLATPFQMAPQAVADEMIEVAERCARVAQAKIVGPASQVPVQPPKQFRQGCVALLCVDELSQRFAFPGQRLGRWPQVPVALWPPIPVAVIPKGVAQEVQALAGLAQIQHTSLPGGSFRARCLLSPRGVRLVRAVVSSQPILASPHPAGWPLPFKCNEAEPSSRDATARAFASPSFGEQGRPHSLWVWLHDFRPIIMINSFQLTRTSQALLGAFRMTRMARMGAAIRKPKPEVRTPAV